MKKLTILSALLAVSLVFFSCSQQTVELSENILQAKVTLVMGTAYILRDDNPAKIAVKMGDLIMPDDVIITGSKSEVNIALENRGVFKIRENSNVSLKNLVYVDDDNNHARVKVTAGQIVLGLQRLSRSSTFEVETPTAVAGVRGTTFMVAVDQKEEGAFPYFVKVRKGDELVTKVAVLSGSVELSNPDNEKDTTMVSALRQATLRNDDFKNIKIEKITRLSLNEIAAVRDFGEIKKLKLDDIAQEIKQAEAQAEDMWQAELKTKAAIKSAAEDAGKTQKDLDAQKIEAQKEAMQKLQQAAPDEDRYLDGGAWE